MGKIEWPSEKDKYEAIGFLAREGVVTNIEANVPKKFIERFKERFKGKYTTGVPYLVGEKKGGDQYRITLSHVEGCPDFLLKQVDGKTKRRINDTNFIRDLVDNYGFIFTSSAQNSDLIRSIVKEMGDEKYKWFSSTFYPNETFLSSLTKVSSNVDNVVVINQSEKIETDTETPSSKVDKKVKKKRKKTNIIKENTYSEDQLQRLGWIGEKYFYELIKSRNKELLKSMEIGSSETCEIQWFNEGFEQKSEWTDKSIGKGCDMYIIENGQKYFVEVKSSRKNPRAFTMTRNELLKMEQQKEKYFLIKINYLERLLKEGNAEITVFRNPYDKFFKTKLMKTVTFELEGDKDE